MLARAFRAGWRTRDDPSRGGTLAAGGGFGIRRREDAVRNNVWVGGTLDALFGAKEGGIRDWLEEAGSFLHPCACGKTVYDPQAVGKAVQKAFGHTRANEISAWAGQLAERFGWGHQTAAAPERGIYYCRHCDPHHQK